MHQEYAIPWNKLASHFQFIRENPHSTPRRTGLFPRNNPAQAQDLDLFRRTLTETIIEFSTAERKKYDEVYSPPQDGKLFSDELRDRYWGSGINEDYLNEEKQNLEYWIEASHTPEGSNESTYSTTDGDLAEAVKILFSENQISTLLMLAQHPKVPLEKLNHLSWGHHFGFSRVMKSALEVYVLVNLFTAMGILEDGRYAETREWQAFLCHQRLVDYPGQVLFHISYFDRMERDPDESKYPGITQRPLIHKNSKLLEEYVKNCFELLYRHDMILRECGANPEWDSAITSLIGWWGVPTHCTGDGQGVPFKYSFLEESSSSLE